MLRGKASINGAWVCRVGRLSDGCCRTRLQSSTAVGKHMRPHGKTHTTSCRPTPVAASRPPSLSPSTPLFPQRTQEYASILVTGRRDDGAPEVYTGEGGGDSKRRQVGQENGSGAENRKRKRRAAPRWLVVSNARDFGGADAALPCPADPPSGLPPSFPHCAMLAVCLNPFV